MNPTYLASEALLNWIEASNKRDPSATFYWKEYLKYSGIQRSFIQKARSEDVDSLQTKIQNVVREETQWLEQTLRGQDPDHNEWMQYCDRIAQRVARDVFHIFEESVHHVYLNGIDAASQELHISAFSLGGIHQAAIEQARSGEGLAQTFANFSDEVSRRLKTIISDAYEQGRYSNADILQRLVNEVGWEARSRLTTIARTESHKIWQTARANTYRQVERERNEKFRYRFGTVQDKKTCDICQAVIDSVPHEGLELEELAHLVVQMSTTPPIGNPSWDPERDGGFPLCHPNCRHVFYRITNIPVEPPEPEEPDIQLPDPDYLMASAWTETPQGWMHKHSKRFLGKHKR